MKVRLLKPSSTEAVIGTTDDPSAVAEVEPRRWSAHQQTLTVMPIEVLNDEGAVVESALIQVNQKSGNLTLTKLSATALPCDIDKPQKKKKAASL